MLPSEPITVEEFQTAMLDLAQTLGEDPFHEPLRACMMRVARGQAENIVMQEASDGGQWPRHAPSTVERHGPHPLLVLSGALLGSVTTPGAQYNIADIQDRTMTWGTSAPYGPTHQYGDDERNIPQREFLYISEAVYDDCVEILSDHIDQKILG